MNCCVTSCKGKSYIVFPVNELVNSPQSFCFAHYKSLRQCTNVHTVKHFYKNCAILDSTKSSNGHESKANLIEATSFSCAT